jgi:hypothetical protein
MKKLLQLATYPVANPLHGGQIRVSKIADFFRKAGWEVKNISVCESTHRGYTDDDMIINSEMINKEVNVNFCADYATSLMCVKDPVYGFLKQKISKFKPDMIFIEQSWMWPAVKKMKDENLLGNAKIVYSSHNVEYKSKEQLLSTHEMLNDDARAVIQKIYELEKECCEKSDYTVSCTEEDARLFQSLGSRTHIVCQNGVSPRNVTDDSVASVKKQLQDRKFIFFVGSAYPPNCIGFWEMLGGSLAWLPPEYVIVAAGGVSQILESYAPKEDLLYQSVRNSKILNLGFISEELLAALIESAGVIILPITIGGGSNLKTAEAAVSCRPVVATSVACRGYEGLQSLSNFSVADNRNDFVRAIMGYLRSAQSGITLPDYEILKRNQFYWENTLKDLSILVNEI